MIKKLFPFFFLKNQKQEKQTIIRVLQYFYPYKWVVITAFIASGFVSLSTAGIAWLIKPALDDIFIRKDVEAIVYIPIIFIMLTLLKGIGRYVQNWCMSYSSFGVLEKLRQELFHKIIRLPLSFYETSQTGSLMSYVINDVGMIRQSLPAIIQAVRQFLTIGGLLYVVFTQNFSLACWALIVLPIAAFPFVMFSVALRRYGRRSAEIIAKTSSLLQELLSGIRTIKAFATEKEEINRFDIENSYISKLSLRQSTISELSSPVMELIGSIGVAIAIWYGGTEVLEDKMTPGTFFSFVAALIMLYEPVKALSNANMSLQNALAGAERIFGILDDSKLHIETGGSVLCGKEFYELTFDHVTLHYDSISEPALNDVSLTVRAGEKIALVGPSGAGKSTFVSLIPRFYEPQVGSIFFNGRLLTEYDLVSLRQSMAIVSQEPFLFNMSIRDNIAYGQPLEIRDNIIKIQAAAVAAFADEFIDLLPDGYNTKVGERGVKLSGGQKQRITIARALLKDPSLLILDEATSSLDSESERMVQGALENLMRNRTSLIIAHRLSTILESDRIIVFEDGKIVASGKHKELLGSCELYTRLYMMQFRTGELQNASIEKGC